jgi:HAD superfamily hydrolase (TIGR01509 family)
MLTAVIFDLDGLLMDTEPVWHQARIDLFKRFGLTWTKEDQERCMGVSTSAWVNAMVEKLGGRLSPSAVLEEILSRMAESYAKGDVQILPGARLALEFTSTRFRLGLASGSPRRLIDAALAGAKWTVYFQEVLSSDDVRSGKPKPDVYVEIMRRIRVRADETVVVEDSGNGILAGLAAGAKVVAVPNRFMRPSADILDKATAVIGSLEHLSEALARLERSGGSAY